MKKEILLCIFIILFFAVPASASEKGSTLQMTSTETPPNGELVWKGITWDIRSDSGAPGPNVFNPNGVYVDSKNKMHLTISKIGDTWKCSEVDSRNKYGYGTFTWTVDSPVFSYDKNSVVGLFTYLDDSQELDVEISRWGVASGNNLWYSVQPYSLSGNNYGSTENYAGTTIHTIVWAPDAVRFKTTTASGEVLSEFEYSGEVPSNPQYAIMNLWLTDGLAPSDGKNIDLVISDFSYEAYQDPEPVENTDPVEVIENPEFTEEPELTDDFTITDMDTPEGRTTCKVYETLIIYKTFLGAGTPPATEFLSKNGNSIDYTAVPASSTDPTLVQFKDLSNGTETYISWEFGDGTYLTGTKITPELKNPIHKFPKPGYYIGGLTIRCAGYNGLLWVHKTVIIKAGGGSAVVVPTPEPVITPEPEVTETPIPEVTPAPDVITTPKKHNNDKNKHNYKHHSRRSVI